MPELPEVELHARRLRRWLVGRVVERVQVEDAGAIRPRPSTRPSEAMPDGPARLQRLPGARVEAVLRRGKRLGMRLTEAVGTDLLLHLGMTGRWVRRSTAEAGPPRHARLGLAAGGRWHWFVDARRFGCVVPMAPTELRSALERGLGPDALEPLGGSELAARVCRGRGRAAVKVALMDQSRLAGLGNIHVVEVLFQSGVHPARPVGELSASEWERLAELIPRHLRAALAEQPGDGDVAYLTEGEIDNPFAVYARAGQPCPHCGEEIERARQSGRSTFWCPGCQPRG